MIILVGIGCFMAGAVVGIVMMSLCVAGQNIQLFTSIVFGACNHIGKKCTN